MIYVDLVCDNGTPTMVLTLMYEGDKIMKLYFVTYNAPGIDLIL